MAFNSETFVFVIGLSNYINFGFSFIGHYIGYWLSNILISAIIFILGAFLILTSKIVILNCKKNF